MEDTTNPWGMDLDQFGQLFISNSVTPHLYHVIFGGHVERRTASPYSTHAYGLLPPAADHLHWVGPSWDKSKGGAPDQLAVGGGHAHCGLLIYQADALPAQYRNSIELVKLQLDTNEWFVRHARRILQERGPDPLVHAQLKQILNTNPDITRRLRALWALHVTDGPIDSALLDDRNEYLRAWTIQLLV